MRAIHQVLSVGWTARKGAPRARAALVALILSGGTAYFASVIDERYPIRQWLFWRYVGYWLYCGFFSAACLGAGHRLLQWLTPRRRPLDEHVTLSFALGLLTFYCGMFVGGLFGWFGTAFSLLFPLGLMGVGARSLIAHVWRRWRSARHLRSRAPALQSRWSRLVAWFGFFNLAVLYFAILSPDNIAFDARWYHVAIGEHYAAARGIGPFVEGWYHAALPQLTSIIFTWAFILPGDLFDRLVLSSHLEFTVLLWLLVGIRPLVRRLLPAIRVPGAWVAFFLFHQMLLQSNFAANNDVFGAVWAVPVFLAFLDALPRLEPRCCALLGALLAGAISVKLQAFSIAAFPVMGIAIRSLCMAVSTMQKGVRHPSWLLGPAAAAATALLLTTPFWLKNWLWYGDPLYPFLHRYLSVRPWTPDSAHLIETVLQPALWQPEGTLWQKLEETLPVLWRFSFEPHDFPTWNGLLPLFGSLMTLSLPALPFLGVSRRVWALACAIHVGIFAWYWTHHQDRYLIMLVPWMAALIATVIALAWRLGALPRLALVAWVGLEAIWGADATFLPLHPMLGDTSLKTSIALVQTGFRKDYKSRLRVYGPMHKVNRALPEGSKVLIHDITPHLGLGAESIRDFGGAFQGGISYGRWATPSRMYEELKRLGATHILWPQGRIESVDSVAGELMFHEFVTNRVGKARRFGELRLAPMPSKPPSDVGWSDRVAFLGCGRSYASGLYHVRDMTVPALGEHKSADYPAPVCAEREGPLDFAEAGFIVNDRSCRPTLDANVRAGFVHVATRDSAELWVRKL